MAKNALLIAVGKYQPESDETALAVKNVLALQQVLQNPFMGGFNSVRSIINPTQASLAIAIKEFSSNCAPQDLLLFFLSGYELIHQNGTFYFSVCSDTQDDETLVKELSITTQQLQSLLKSSPSKHQVLILDCVFDANTVARERQQSQFSDDFSAELEREDRIILSSPLMTEYSCNLPNFDLSPYTYFLVEGIRTGMADQNQDGAISVNELHTYIEEKITEILPETGKPHLFAVDSDRDFVISHVPQVDDLRLHIYRQEVDCRIRDGKISFVARNLLDRKRIDLGLSAEVAAEIEAEVLRPFREYEENLLYYEQILVGAIEREKLLSPGTLQELQELQKYLDLKDADVAALQARVIPQTLSGHTEKSANAADADEAVAPVKLKVVNAPESNNSASAKHLKIVEKLETEAETPVEESQHSNSSIPMANDSTATAAITEVNDHERSETLSSEFQTDSKLNLDLAQIYQLLSSLELSLKAGQAIDLTKVQNLLLALQQENPLNPDTLISLQILQQSLSQWQQKAATPISHLINRSEDISPRRQTPISAAQVLVHPPPVQSLADVMDFRSAPAIDYTPLEKFLGAQKWKAADQETARVLMQLMNRLEQGYFEEEHLNSIPCIDLQTIDQLWLHYSQGRFGLTAQLQIYIDCQGSPDGKFDQRVWKQFGDRTGWRINGNWQNFDDLLFDGSAPVGHLPATIGFLLWTGSWFGSCVWVTAALVQRLVQCLYSNERMGTKPAS
jgi:hypothetical protein